IHPELRGTDSRIEALRIPRPDREERAGFLRWLATFDEWAGIRDDRLLEGVANRTSGMNYDELRELARSIKADGGWEALIKSRRDEIIQRESGGLLVSKESRFGLADIAGYAYVREYLDRILAQLRQGRADITGVLFAGPPGTGKSFYAGALARDAGVNVVVMRSLRGMYVGQSERNLEQVLEVARSLAPVIIFVDEVDQAFSNRRQQSTDGGVDQRLLGRLLEFMDDKENLGKVIWVAASNRPVLLDEALLSRFRIRVPFLLPDLATCCELLREKLPQQAGFAWEPQSWTQQREHALAGGVAGRFSVRELETIVSVARWHGEEAPVSGTSAGAAQAGGKLIDAKHLAEAIKNAEVGHNENEYLRQSLLAIKYAPYKVEQLVEALETALPAEVSRHILRNGGIDSVQLNLLLERIPRPPAIQ
ncbi:MAG TPA: ATP-binding protein, partial [Herpetosiphonaceae bacterium]|nr:ATP-binding protein [Herpetosiphonaceae bacterium]